MLLCLIAEFKVYVDAELQKTVVRAGARAGGDGRLILSRLYGNSDSYYNTGCVDELLLFDRVLTDDEVSLLSGFTG